MSISRSIRGGLRELAHIAVGAAEAGNGFRGRYGLILNYHSVIAPGERGPVWRGLVVPANQLRRQLSWLSRRFRIVDMRSFLEEYRAGFPEDSPVTLTFDDGWRDNLVVVAPILQELKVPASIFLTTGNVESGEPFWWTRIGLGLAAASLRTRAVKIDLGTESVQLPVDSHHSLGATYDFLAGHVMERGLGALDAIVEQLGQPDGQMARLVLSWDEVSKLEEMGWSVGAHTVNHVILSQVSQEQAREEMVGSLEAVRRHVRDPLLVFCFTNGAAGDFTDQHVQELRRIGVEASLTMAHGPVTPGADPYTLPRLKVDGEYRYFAFSNLVAGRCLDLRHVIPLVKRVSAQRMSRGATLPCQIQ